MMQTACGTPGYVAPEVLQAQGYGPEVDLWSIGVITYILLCGFPPFYHEELPELFEQIMSADFDFPEEYWDSVSSEAKDFIKKLLVVKPSDRMSVDQALAHPWLKVKTFGWQTGIFIVILLFFFLAFFLSFPVICIFVCVNFESVIFILLGNFLS